MDAEEFGGPVSKRFDRFSEREARAEERAMTLEEMKAELRRSAEEHRGKTRPVKPLLQMPEGVVDVTSEAKGKTYVIIGPVRKRD
jgi:hypothetical protein